MDNPTALNLLELVLLWCKYQHDCHYWNRETISTDWGLTWSQRLTGFAACFGLGLLCSLLSTLFMLQPTKFGITYSFGYGATYSLCSPLAKASLSINDYYSTSQNVSCHWLRCALLSLSNNLEIQKPPLAQQHRIPSWSRTTNPEYVPITQSNSDAYLFGYVRLDSLLCSQGNLKTISNCKTKNSRRKLLTFSTDEQLLMENQSASQHHVDVGVHHSPDVRVHLVLPLLHSLRKANTEKVFWIMFGWRWLLSVCDLTVEVMECEWEVRKQIKVSNNDNHDNNHSVSSITDWNMNFCSSTTISHHQ